jgi:cell shape-determining protein MreC
MLQVQYKEELDEQKRVEEKMKTLRRENDRKVDMQKSKEKAPYSRY